MNNRYSRFFGFKGCFYMPGCDVLRLFSHSGDQVVDELNVAFASSDRTGIRILFASEFVCLRINKNLKDHIQWKLGITGQSSPDWRKIF